MFSKYHYLSHSHNNAATCFVMFANDKLCGFTSAIHFPHPNNSKIKREHRTVILPDYQGIGLGSILSEFVANYYTSNGFDYISVTSNPAFIKARQKSDKWALTRTGRTGRTGMKSLDKTISGENRLTTAWKYVKNRLKTGE